MLNLEWMKWTPATAIFFISIAGMLAVMLVWELRSPSMVRKGFLPLRTTRGDRFFISLLCAAFITIAWLAITDLPPMGALVLSITTMLFIARWG